MSGQTLRAAGLRRRYGERVAVDGVDLEVGPGEVVGLLGPNGAGKTTVFRLLMGLARPHGGEVWLGPRALTALPPHRRARLGLGYLPQGSSAFRGLSVEQNVIVALQLAGADRSDAAELLASFGLERLAGQRADTLSGGELRRLELARMLAARPAVALLDEPFAGLDPLGTSELRGMIRQLARQCAVGVLVTDHAVEQALSCCQRAYIIVDGRIVAQGDPAAVTLDPAARSEFFGPTSNPRSSPWHSSSSSN